MLPERLKHEPCTLWVPAAHRDYTSVFTGMGRRSEELFLPFGKHAAAIIGLVDHDVIGGAHEREAESSLLTIFGFINGVDYCPEVAYIGSQERPGTLGDNASDGIAGVGKAA